MPKVTNVRKDKLSEEGTHHYKWDVIDGKKQGTFYTNEKGKNIWIEKKSGINHQIWSEDLVFNSQLKININKNTTNKTIENDVQKFADQHIFDKWLE